MFSKQYLADCYVRVVEDDEGDELRMLFDCERLPVLLQSVTLYCMRAGHVVSDSKVS